MKINRRDEKLDALLGKKVTVTFWDKTEKTGIISWQGAFEPRNGLLPYRYHVLLDSGVYYGFRKSHVIHVREVKE